MNELKLNLEEQEPRDIQGSSDPALSEDRVDENINPEIANRRDPGRLLFVDDDEGFLKLVQRLFEGANYRVLTTQSASEALKILQKNAVDVVISDMCMPGLDGAELMAEVQKSHPEVIRFIISGKIDHFSTINAINKGHVHGYIAKPFKGKDLKLAIYAELLKKDRHKKEEKRKKEQQENLKQRARDLGAAVMKSKSKAEELFDEMMGLLIDLTADERTEQAATVACKIAVEAGCSKSEIEQIRFAALLQDLSLMKSPARPMNDEELHEQSLASANLLSRFTQCKVAAEIVACLHEQFSDRGEDVPIGSRILAIANEYVKWRTGEREYDHHDAVDQMTRKFKFDPELLALLLHSNYGEK